MSNKLKYYIATPLYALFFMFTSGAVLQTFLLEKGFSEENTNIYFSLIQILQIMTIMLFSAKADKIKRIVKATVKFHLLELPFIVFLAAFCFSASKPDIFIFIALALTTVLFNIGIGIHNVLSYKLPYKILDMKYYGVTLSVSGMLSGTLSFVFSVILSFLQNSFDYLSSMKLIFIAAIVIFSAYLRVTASYKENDEEKIATTRPTEKFNFLKFKPFSKLIAANILRGFCAGIIGMAVSIGYYNKCLDSSSAAVLVVITNVATILGCVFYSLISGKVRERNIILISSIAVFIFMPLMLINKDPLTFLIFYGIAYFFIILINYAVPVAVSRIASYEIAGQYNAGRMLLNTLGISIAGFFCIPLFRFIGVMPTMILSAGTQLISGIAYYFTLKTEKNLNA